MACVRGSFLLLLFVHCAVSQQNHCGEPTIYLDKRLDNRYLHKIHFTDGNRVAYSCLPGYTRTMGSRMSFCKNGRWTALDMTCDKKKCNPLTELENGQYRQNGLSFGDEAFAVCNDGYVLKGEKVRVCEEMGWSGQDPICVPQYSGSVKDKTCSKLSIEPNGTVEVLKSDHGQEYEIIITCKTGFNGSGVYKCNGERWEPAEPKCCRNIVSINVKCPVINISNGKPSIVRRRYGSVVVIRCRTRFRPDGAQEIRCDADGSWKPAVPQCVPVSVIRCSPPAVLNGEIISGKNQHYNPRDTVTISCAERFNLIGSSQITCGTDGQCKRLPECRHQVRCSAPSVHNGRIISEEQQHYNPRDHVTVSCTEGFDLIGSSQITCGADGQWKGLPECRHQVRCSAPSVHNGRIISEEQQHYNPRDHVTVSCTEGFDLIGSSQITCGADGQWKGLPECRHQVRCSAPSVHNGRIISEEQQHYNPRDHVTVSCTEGFDLIGSSQITCGADGQWQGLPECRHQVRCSAPSVHNGRIISEEQQHYNPRDHVTVSCTEGFDLIGSSQITCGADGQWQDLPECRQEISETGNCGRAHIYEFARPRDEYLLKREYMPGDRVRYKCVVGYRWSGGRDTIYCINGRWTKLELNCDRKKCGTTGEIFHGHVKYSGISFGDFATVICDEGYEPTGPVVRYCRDGGWEGRNAECEPVYCPPPPVSNADTFDLADEHVPFGHVVSYRCQTGTLIGTRDIHCTKNGSWSAPPPECKDVTCPVPTLTHGSRLMGYRSVYKFRHIEKITCKPGYKLANDDYVTCGIDGKWKPELSEMCVAEKKKMWFY